MKFVDDDDDDDKKILHITIPLPVLYNYILNGTYCTILYSFIVQVERMQLILHTSSFAYTVYL